MAQQVRDRNLPGVIGAVQPVQTIGHRPRQIVSHRCGQADSTPFDKFQQRGSDKQLGDARGEERRLRPHQRAVGVRVTRYENPLVRSVATLDRQDRVVNSLLLSQGVDHPPNAAVEIIGIDAARTHSCNVSVAHVRTQANNAAHIPESRGDDDGSHVYIVL